VISLDELERTSLSGVAPAQADLLKQRAMRALGDLPPFSPILNRLMASLAGEDVSFHELGDLIEKDTVVAGNILALVNSAIYARRSTVNSVRHALALLGLLKIRNAVLGMSIAGMWNQARTVSGWSMARFNMHSAAVAMLSDALVQHVPVEYPEGAFIAGLLHDVGRLLIVMGLPKEFTRLVRTQAELQLPMIDCENRSLGFTHADLSEMTLKVWKLPEPVQAAVGSHHDPIPQGPGAKFPLAAVVAAANACINSLGISTWERAPENEPYLAGIEALGLERERAEKLLTDFETDYQAMAPFFR
jgi:HD-like signal output (HDOD) protein